MAIKRSPRYPRLDLSKAVDMAERLYRGAHQSKIDADTAARVMGYTNSASGAAAIAIGALRQYGLVDGLRGEVNISDLAMRILQPMNDAERAYGLREAANNPEIFGLVLSQFAGELPKSDEPIKAYLVRQQGFSASGAAEVVGILRDTMSSLPPEIKSESESPVLVSNPDASPAQSAADLQSERSYQSASEPFEGELIVLPLGSSCKAELRFTGDVTTKAYDRLIKHLQLLRETLDDE